jgi:ribonuclease E
MDEGRNNRMVERRMKDALKHDRARIQVGRISHFGLLEMSRQRIRTSVLESSTEKCPTCGGLGHVRSVSSVALQLLRAIEDSLNKGATHNLIVRTRSEVALYVLNHKRAHLRALEERFHITITITADPTVSAQVSYIVERGELMHTPEAAKAIAAAAPPMVAVFEEDDYVEPEAEEAEDEGEAMMAAPSSIEVIEPTEAGDEAESAGAGEGDGQRRRRRRGRGRGRSGEGREGSGREPRESREHAAQAHETVAEHAVAHEDHDGGTPEEDDGERPQRAEGAPGSAEGEGSDIRRRRRRGRRGGRRNRHRDGEAPGANGNQEGQEAGFAPDGGEPGYAPRDDQGPDTGNGQDRPVTAPVYAPAAYAAPAEERPAAPEPARPVAEAPAASQEAPRRRSTIREPAPLATGSSPAPAPVLPQPVVVSTVADEPAQPKRGWWGKRLLGDKS